MIIEAQEGLEPGTVSLEYEARLCMENSSYGVGGQSQSFDPSASGSLRLRLRMHEDMALTVSRTPKQPSSYLLHYPDGSTLTTHYRSGAGIDDARMRCDQMPGRGQSSQKPSEPAYWSGSAMLPGET